MELHVYHNYRYVWYVRNCVYVNGDGRDISCIIRMYSMSGYVSVCIVYTGTVSVRVFVCVCVHWFIINYTVQYLQLLLQGLVV